jgi:hypothetical protein
LNIVSNIECSLHRPSLKKLKYLKSAESGEKAIAMDTSTAGEGGGASSAQTKSASTAATVVAIGGGTAALFQGGASGGGTSWDAAEK